MSTGVGHVLTVSTLSGSVLIPSEETTCPRNETSLFRNWHLVGFSLRPAVCILSDTKRRRRRCSSNEEAQIIISSKYTRQCVQVTWFSARFINLVYLAGPFVRPTGITLHWNCPRWVENAVLGLSSSFTCICQCPDAKSRQENHWPPPSAFKISSVLGNGITSFSVHKFSLR